jgi:hypothetical protein
VVVWCGVVCVCVWGGGGGGGGGGCVGVGGGYAAVAPTRGRYAAGDTRRLKGIVRSGFSSFLVELGPG